MRSMINFIQSNQHSTYKLNIINSCVWENLDEKLRLKEPLDNMVAYIHQISIEYNIDKKNIIKDYINYIICKKPEIVSPVFLDFVENIMHFQECKNTHYINYSLSRLVTLLSEA